MAPGRFCYFDGYQDAPATQPEAIGGYLPLELVYSFDPAPRLSVGGCQGAYKGCGGHSVYRIYRYRRPCRIHAVSTIACIGRSGMDSAVAQRVRQLLHSCACRKRPVSARDGYNVFDMRSEVGNRKEALAPVKAILPLNKTSCTTIAIGLRAILRLRPRQSTDGLRGGWNYNDFRWQGFLQRLYRSRP